MKRKYSSVGLLAVLLIMCLNTTVNAAEFGVPKVEETGDSSVNEIADNIPDEINLFAEKNYKDLIEASIPYYPELTSDNVDEYKLQDAYVVYDYDDTNPEIYYYPISLDGKIVMVLSAVNTSEGITISGSEEMVEGLNRIDYVFNSDSVVFYENENSIKAENENGKFLIEELDDASGKEVSEERDFASLELKEKIDIVAESAESTGSQNIEHIQKLSEYVQIEEAYSPSFSSNTSTNKTCKLYNAQGQGDLPICWAASVATIVNYRKGTSITAKNVCDKMDTGYVGVNIDKKKSALAKYGLSYKKTESQLSSSKIKTNINNKYPIAASTFDSSGSGHAVTVYGWSMPSVTDFIIIWNSGTSSSQTIY